MRKYHKEIGISLLLILATFSAFWQVSSHDFINFDDDEYVTENPRVRAGLTKETFIWAFTEFHSNNWHPLTWLSHALDCQLFGLDHPGRHLMINLLFHIANTLLLFLLLRRMTGAVWPSGFVAALFALHPLHVESVAWVSERKDVLSAFFWMLTMLAYTRYTEEPKITRYLAALLLFVLGLMAKPMLVTLPFVMLLMDYWPLNRLPEYQDPKITPRASRLTPHASCFKPLIWEKLPFFALTVISSIITVFAQRAGGLVRSLEVFPMSVRIGNAMVSYIAYISKMIWPRNLAFHYPHPGTSLPLWKAAAAGLLLAGISAAVIRAGRKYPYLTVGWLWYLGTLLPVIGLVQVASQAMADRYTYIPLIGIFIMMAWGIPALIRERPYQRVILSVCACLILIGCGVLTRFQVNHWKNSVTLFSHTLNVTENNYLANNSLGAALEKQGYYKEAARYLTEALRIKPDGVQAHYNMGVVADHQGKNQAAIKHFSQALRFKPDFANAHYNLGIALKRQGDLKGAVRHFYEAVKVRPDFAEAHNHLGSALSKQGKEDEALKHYYRAIRINPDYAEAHNNAGTVLKRQGKYKEAVRHYYQALKLKPDFAEARLNLGVALGSQGKHAEAMTYFIESLKINPNLAEAHYGMGVALTQKKKFKDAAGHYEQAIEINPDLAEAHFNLGVLLANQNKLSKAAVHFRETLRINPDHAKAHNNLGSVLAREGKMAEAVKHFSEAYRLDPNSPDTKKNLELGRQLLKQSKIPDLQN